MKKSVLFIILLLTACLGVPDNIKPVENFNTSKYLGTWYEIARLDHSFERGLSEVTAIYSLRDDGEIKVVNRGYSEQDSKWEETSGKAYFVDGPDKGYLKVSFFGPFYSSYIVFDVDEDYQYALVTGADKDYFWLLARTPVINETTKAALIKKAAELGFDTSKLVYVKHSPQDKQSF